MKTKSITWPELQEQLGCPMCSNHPGCPAVKLMLGGKKPEQIPDWNKGFSGLWDCKGFHLSACLKLPEPKPEPKQRRGKRAKRWEVSK
jgi:hypothetical protein